jgi:DNA-binding response OmpR family regulator
MADRILIVEDDPLISMMIEDFLEILGKESAGVTQTVAGALEHIARGGFDAAIVDVHLANGKTAEPVAAALAAADIPFLVATGGYLGTDPGWEGRPILSKPFILATLEAALNAL